MEGGCPECVFKKRTGLVSRLVGVRPFDGNIGDDVVIRWWRNRLLSQHLNGNERNDYQCNDGYDRQKGAADGTICIAHRSVGEEG